MFTAALKSGVEKSEPVELTSACDFRIELRASYTVARLHSEASADK